MLAHIRLARTQAFHQLANIHLPAIEESANDGQPGRVSQDPEPRGNALKHFGGQRF